MAAISPRVPGVSRSTMRMTTSRRAQASAGVMAARSALRAGAGRPVEGLEVRGDQILPRHQILALGQGLERLALVARAPVDPALPQLVLVVERRARVSCQAPEVKGLAVVHREGELRKSV